MIWVCVFLFQRARYHTVNIPIIGGSLRKVFSLLHLQEWQEKTDELCKYPIIDKVVTVKTLLNSFPGVENPAHIRIICAEKLWQMLDLAEK